MVHYNKPLLGEDFVRTNFKLLDKDYKQIIEIRTGQEQGMPQYRSDISHIQSKKIIFEDMSYLTCIEMSNADDELLQYYYEWYNPNRELIMKFHAHYHPDEAPDEVRQYDPFHIHKKESAHDLNLSVREVNQELRGIRQVVNYIVQSQYAFKYY